MDMLVKDLDKEMTIATATEKDAQADYETFMSDSGEAGGGLQVDRRQDGSHCRDGGDIGCGVAGEGRRRAGACGDVGSDCWTSRRVRLAPEVFRCEEGRPG